MKLQELLNKVKSHPKVRKLEEIEKHPPYHFYRVQVQEDEDLVREFAICIVVENEGTEDEVAFFKDSKPIREPAQSPIEQVKEKVVSACGFIKVESFTVNMEEKYALATGFVDNGDGTVSRKTFLAYLDERGSLKVHEVRNHTSPAG